MIEVLHEERKSAVLTPSSLACLAHMPTINLTAGCAHQCRYCYTRGYSTHPGEGKIRFYTNTLTKLRAELARKRKKPVAVYFSPSSDPFQPVPDVLEMAYDIFTFLLDAGIGVAFATKGMIPERHRALLASHAALVRGQIGLITHNARIATAFEPNAASPEVRLAQTAELLAAGIAIESRMDPLLPGLTDDEDSLDGLCRALASAGVRRVAASVLFLRPAVIWSLRRHVTDPTMLQPLLDAFVVKEKMRIHAGKSVVFSLPEKNRRAILGRLGAVAKRHGITVQFCACKNPDIASGTCNIAGRWDESAGGSRQLSLYEGR
ncbi:MAG: hypothetical protein KKA28_10805 [Planctomycetes bacterium]|nr:hypothetical protein [Planctomycetota bacterium]MCG2682577.1 hypothetical protein [Planctomycetales bacterium]